MLSKKQRLSRSQFNLLLNQKTRKITTPCGTFSYIAYPTPTLFGISVVVSKKVAKKAHERNAVRRFFYDSFFIYTKIPFFGFFVVSKEGYSLFLSDKQKVKECIYEFFKTYSEK